MPRLLRRPMPWAIVGAAHSVEELQSAIDGLTHANLAQIRAGDIPPLYESGVVYERETRSAAPVGVERFQTARDALYLGHSDCDGLAPWRAAELIHHGSPARARVVETNRGYHVVVDREDGTREDPSAILGMLDGYEVGSDARTTARARRRRMMGAIAKKAKRALERAASTAGATQGAYLRQANALGRQLSGLERQAHADGDTSDDRDEPARDVGDWRRMFGMDDGPRASSPPAPNPPPARDGHQTGAPILGLLALFMLAKGMR